MKQITTQSRPKLFTAVVGRILLALGFLIGVAGTGVAQGQQPPDALSITKEGNVGVGTVTPVSKLHIHGDSSNTGSGGFALDATDNNNPEQYILRINPFSLGNSRVGYQFQTKSAVGGTQLPLTFDNEGRVGIGTAKPLSGLSISSVKQQANSPNQEIGQLSFVGFGRSVASASIQAQSPGWDDVSHLIFKTSPNDKGAQERMRITSDGNVGIGTPDPAFGKLQIAGAATTALRLDANAGVAALSIGGNGEVLVDAPGVTGGRFVVKDSGNVGIGTPNPSKAKLEINGSLASPVPRFAYLMPEALLGSAPVGISGGTTTSLSLYADQVIAASRFYAFSDARIKRIAGRSDSARDLATLASIEVTDYSYVDSLLNGTGAQKKIIGQQVEKVFPQAVSKSRDVVPDIYQKAKVNDGWVLLATNLKKGERVRLIGEKQEGIQEVLEVAEGRFRTALAADGQVFVYGREVNDARSVDYEAISMLNVSATQELARRLAKLEEHAVQGTTPEQNDAEVKALQDANAALRSQLAAQEKRLAELEAKDKSRDEKLAAIETLLRSTDKPAALTTSLKKVD
jgi:hypothetical protein